MSEAHTHDVGMGPAEPIVSHHYRERGRKDETAVLGRWLFLAEGEMLLEGLCVPAAVLLLK